MFLHVTHAKPLDGYRVAVGFDDGREGVADLTEAPEGPAFESLKDPDAFKTFRIDEELQTIVWPNGTDLAPEYIYYQAFRDDQELQAIFRKWGYIV
ncbi:MAG: DUF2442 domain-containing protein [Nitrospira sp. SB0675_bin_23]|nr:DUF2442 domain-containing protein [Nitrospira sp. SB0667_bin_9]MYD32144.1 DUF2442 domain-containing protein [Nitrospira sp. SB0661_bin_20]MYH02052.1 DUF2442 domain-containing protein [Nitrospira sp. SB0675_bin_23]MYJ22610.1 DUF2442 domain-containing protein [Nitrospira sp. SB0673_bin_12]